MPDDFQYIRLPDGSYGKFASNASDDVIRGAIAKDFPTAFSKPINSMADYANASPADQQAYLSKLPGNVGKEPRIVKAGKLAGQGDYSGAAHQVITGAGEGLAPVAIGPLVSAAVPGMVSATGATIGGAVAGIAGQHLAKMGANALGANPSQQDLAGDVGAMAGGSIGAKIGSVIDSIGERVADPSVLRSALRGVLSRYISSDVARTVLPEPGDDLAAAIKSGNAAKIPVRMSKSQIENLNAVKLSSLSGSEPEDAQSALTGSGDDLISRTQALVKPGVQPSLSDLKRAGDLTQAPLARLQQLAKFGDKLAQLEINRRLKN